jgi:transposase
MPATRIAMRNIRELLRLRYECALSFERIARALEVSKGVVAKYVQLAKAAGVSWPLPPEWDDVQLEQRLCPSPSRCNEFVPPDFAWVHQERKKKGVTLLLLCEEYRAQTPGRTYLYTQFCTLYQRWVGLQKRSMRQVHRAGEKLFIDFAGPTVPIIDAATGEIRRTNIFVAVLGASNYTFACATATQGKADWLGAQVKALEFIGGVPELIVPDNARALIAQPDRYEPKANRSYQEFAAHYATALLPARPAKPRDKAKVEVGVQIVERWILARLRHRQFFGLDELNAAIAELLADLNNRPFKRLPGSRQSAFEQLDRPALKALPLTRYEFAAWRQARVNIDYHVEVDRHFYSVPHALVRRAIDVRTTDTTVECFWHGRRVASHQRSRKPGAYTTVAEHMPKAHRAHMQWSPGKLLTWAHSIGPATRGVVRYQLEHRAHPEQGYRACLGLLALARKYGEARLEAACRRALALGAPFRKSVLSILQAGLDQQSSLFTEPRSESHLPAHDNVRGPDYYQ